MREQIQTILRTTTGELRKEGLLNGDAQTFIVEIPRLREHGDYSSNIAMVLASLEKRPPRKIAELIKERILLKNLFESVEIAGPGFINMRIKREAFLEELHKAISKGREYGRSELGKGRKVLLEFVSANPTGPLHLGHGRGAAFGDTLARVLDYCGFDVTREFYINDAGRQVRLLGLSIFSRYMQRRDKNYPFPQDGYHGSYVEDLLDQILAERDIDGMEEQEAIGFLADKGKEIMLREIEADLRDFGVHFDIWKSEKGLFVSGDVDKAIDRLHGLGFIYSDNGALWLRTTAFGDDKDRVIKKSDGEYTYFASDIAYHLEKWNRGYNISIDIWGADHHGYIPRVSSALSCFNIPDGWFKVLLIQLVKLWSKGNEIKMSKRAGTYVTLRELMNEAGVDAVRFMFLTKHNDSALDFDLDLAKKKDQENPVYYVQYAHARLSSILRKSPIPEAELKELRPEELNGLCLEEELELIRLILDFPGTLRDIATSFEPHRLTYYLLELAAGFHRYFNLGNKDPQKRVICQEPSLTRARLGLCLALRSVICKGLELLGVSAPTIM